MPVPRARGGHGRRGSTALQRGGDGHKLNRRVRPAFHLALREPTITALSTAVCPRFGARPVPRCHTFGSHYPATGSVSGAVEGAGTDTQDDKPERSAPEDGKGVPPGWYADPVGGWDLRWWDGARWTEHTAVPPQTVKPGWTWSLSNVFQIEIGLALLGLLVSLLGVMGLAGCPGGSERCYSLYGKVWLWLVVVQAVLVSACSAAFWWSKWIGVKRAAALLLPVGMVVSWVVADRLITKAYDM